MGVGWRSQWVERVRNCACNRTRCWDDHPVVHCVAMYMLPEFMSVAGSCAFGHVEAMQTLDLPLLAEHLSLVLHHLAEDVAVSSIEKGTARVSAWLLLGGQGTGLHRTARGRCGCSFCCTHSSLQVLSVYYLERIGDQLEELGEDR